MIRRLLGRIAAAARFVAAALVFVTAARFAAVAVGDVLAASSTGSAPKPSPREAPGSLAVKPTDILEEIEKLKDRDHGGGPGRDGGRRGSRRVTIAVSVGPPRSEVYVNGSFVGHSPFVGDVSCKEGREIKVELVPVKGAPLTYVRGCDSETVRISEE